MKSIIPYLVSLDTDFKRLYGFYLKSFDFFPETNKNFKIHYRVKIDNHIQVPLEYDFRHSYYIKKDDLWYYQRKFGGLVLKFCFNPQEKIFLFNKSYSFLPIELGNIFPAGRHLANLVGLDCFLDKYLIIGGCAFRLKGKNYGLITPGFVGKTTFMEEILARGASYISEDILCLDYQNNFLYPTGCSFFNVGRSINFKLRKKLYSKVYPVIQKPMRVDKLFLVQPSTNKRFRPLIKDLFEFSFLNSLFFLNNPFIRAFLFKEKLIDKVLDKIEGIRKLNFKKNFRSVVDYDFLKLLK